MTTLEEQVKAVAAARAINQEANTRRNETYQKFLADNEQLYTNERDSAAKCEEAENLLRELTLKAYEETGNKNPALGVSVKVFQVLDYEPKEALKWAMEHQIALSLDKKSFEGFAKATPLEFVTVTEEPRAQIATNLEVK